MFLWFCIWYGSFSPSHLIALPTYHTLIPLLAWTFYSYKGVPPKSAELAQNESTHNTLAHKHTDTLTHTLSCLYKTHSTDKLCIIVSTQVVFKLNPLWKEWNAFWSLLRWDEIGWSYGMSSHLKAGGVGCQRICSGLINLFSCQCVQRCAGTHL